MSFESFDETLMSEDLRFLQDLEQMADVTFTREGIPQEVLQEKDKNLEDFSTQVLPLGSGTSKTSNPERERLTQRFNQLMLDMGEINVMIGMKPEFEWDEAVFEQKYKNLKVKFYGEDVRSRVNTAKVFLNWFVGADMGVTFDLGTLLLKTLGFFNNMEECPLIQILAPEDSSASTSSLQKSITAKKVDKLDLSKDIAAESYFTAPMMQSFQTVKIFYNSCWANLELKASNKEGELLAPQDRVKILYATLNYLGYLGLITSRYAIKSQTSVTRYYLRVATKEFNNIQGTEFPWITPPPHAQSIQAILKDFTKRSPAFSTFLITEIKVYKVARNLNTNIFSRLLTAGNLQDFSFNGMLLINIASKLCFLVNMTLKQLIKNSHFTIYNLQLHRLIDVANKFFKSENAAIQISFPWCRLLDDNYMRRLAGKPNKPLLDLWQTAIARIEGNYDVWALYPWNGKIPTSPLIERWVCNFISKYQQSS